MKRIRPFLAALAAVTLLGMSTTAQAAPVQFAGYTQTSTGFPITFNNATGNIGGSAQVAFSYTNVGTMSPAVLNGPIDATLTLVISGAQPVQSYKIPPPFGPTFLYGSFTTATITITANSPIAGMTNLLTAQIGNVGSIFAQQGSTVPNYSGQGDETNILYTSDFVAFSPTYAAAFNIGFILKNGLTKTGIHFSNNTASSGGQFAAEPLPIPVELVPEPTSIALLGLGLIGAPIALRLRRKTGAENA